MFLKSNDLLYNSLGPRLVSHRSSEFPSVTINVEDVYKSTLVLISPLQIDIVYLCAPETSIFCDFGINFYKLYIYHYSCYKQKENWMTQCC